MSNLRISPELAFSPLEREMLLCQDAAHLEPEPVRTLAYDTFNIAAAFARTRYTEWIIPSEALQVGDEEVIIETVHFDTCTLSFNAKGRNGFHEIGLHAVRGLVGFKVDEPVRYDIVEEVYGQNGPRLVMNTSDPIDRQAGINRNSGYISEVIKDWKEKRSQGLTDYPVSARATKELTAALASGRPLNREEFRAMMKGIFSAPGYAARYYGFK